MKKILSERNLVIVLFIAALTVFSFAQEDAKKLEKLSQGNTAQSSLLKTPEQTASNNLADDNRGLLTTPITK